MRTKCSDPDCMFPECTCWDDRENTSLNPRHNHLGKFYSVDNYEKLVDLQSEHIARLQKKLPPLKDDQPGKVRC